MRAEQGFLDRAIWRRNDLAVCGLASTFDDRSTDSKINSGLGGRANSREWGADAEQDPSFAAMVDAVEAGIAGSDRLRKVFREAVASLQSKRGGPRSTDSKQG